jgi:hypothetical protein
VNPTFAFLQPRLGDLFVTQKLDNNKHEFAVLMTQKTQLCQAASRSVRYSIEIGLQLMKAVGEKIVADAIDDKKQLGSVRDELRITVFKAQIEALPDTIPETAKPQDTKQDKRNAETEDTEQDKRSAETEVTKQNKQAQNIASLDQAKPDHDERKRTISATGGNVKRVKSGAQDSATDEKDNAKDNAKDNENDDVTQKDSDSEPPCKSDREESVDAADQKMETSFF